MTRPALGDDSVAVGFWATESRGGVLVLDQASGAPVWTRDLDAGLRTAPALAGGRLFLRTLTGLYALDARDGSELWHVPLEGDDSAPAVGGGAVIVGSTGLLAGFDPATGEERWRLSTPGTSWATPAFRDGVVYAGATNDTHVAAFEVETRTECWRQDVNAYVFSSPVLDGGTLFVTGWQGWVYALDACTGVPCWAFETDFYAVATPLVADGMVYATASDTHLYAIDALTGEERWRYATFGGIKDPAILAGGVLYVTSSDVAMYAIAAGTGAELWHFPAGDVSGDPGGEGPAPVIGGTSIYVVLERTLHALDLP
jgi:outer membrane protein assembly factor BamB